MNINNRLKVENYLTQLDEIESNLNDLNEFKDSLSNRPVNGCAYLDTNDMQTMYLPLDIVLPTIDEMIIRLNTNKENILKDLSKL